MEHSVFFYHDSKRYVKPKNVDYNIKGLELEISDHSVGEILDDLINEDIITAPCNVGTKKDLTICIENDSSVYKELVFKATSNRNLLKGVKILEDRLSGYIENGHSTSCHIHINNKHLRKRGIRQYEISKASEFLAPILYRVSGRDYDSMEWCKSVLRRDIDIEDIDLLKRARLVDNYEDYEYDCDRYLITNLNSSTTEIRIFSNYYNFNYNYIRLYLNLVDLIIDIAEEMRGKSYYEEYDDLIKKIKKFFNRYNNKFVLKENNIEDFFLTKVELRKKELRKRISNIELIMNDLIRDNERTNRVDYIRLLRFLRNYKNKYNEELRIQFRLDNNENELLRIKNELIENLTNELNNL